jgi:hypothetical protein
MREFASEFGDGFLGLACFAAALIALGWAADRGWRLAACWEVFGAALVGSIALSVFAELAVKL